MVSNSFLLVKVATARDRNSQLLLACKIGAARELYEETGLDLRSKLHRFEPASLRSQSKIKNGVEILGNEYKSRLFFFLAVTGDDFPVTGQTPMGNEGKNLKVRRAARSRSYNAVIKPLSHALFGNS